MVDCANCNDDHDECDSDYDLCPFGPIVAPGCSCGCGQSNPGDHLFGFGPLWFTLNARNHWETYRVLLNIF